MAAEAQELLDSAYDEFRNAGYPDYTVRGLLERAHFHRVRRERGGERDDYLTARGDLKEATFEAQRGEMELLYADILLQRAACYLDFWPELSTSERAEVRREAPEVLGKVADLVDELGYARRSGMVGRLRQAAATAGLLDG